MPSTEPAACSPASSPQRIQQQYLLYCRLSWLQPNAPWTQSGLSSGQDRHKSIWVQRYNLGMKDAFAAVRAHGKTEQKNRQGYRSMQDASGSGWGNSKEYWGISCQIFSTTSLNFSLVENFQSSLTACPVHAGAPGQSTVGCQRIGYGYGE